MIFNNIYLFAKRKNINFIIHTHGNVKENRNTVCVKAGGTEEYTLSSQVSPHPVQSKTKFTNILIKYFNTYTDTNLFDVKPM